MSGMSQVSVARHALRERSEPPLATVERNLRSFKRKTAHRGTLSVNGHEVDVHLETDSCLAFRLPLSCVKVKTRLADLDLLMLHRQFPASCKFAGDGRVRSLLSETWLGKKVDMCAAVRSAKEGWAGAIALLCREKRRAVRCKGWSSVEHTDEREAHSAVEDVLSDVGIALSPRRDAWATSYDSEHFIHRIRLTLRSRNGQAAVLLETPGEQLDSLGQAAAEAIGRFLLEANGKMRFVRFSLVKAGGNGAMRQVTEANIPLVLFQSDRVRATLEALVVGADRTRGEIAALSQEGVAQDYLRITGDNHEFR